MARTDVFDRYDFLTTIVPGAAFLFAVSILFTATGPASQAARQTAGSAPG